MDKVLLFVFVAACATGIEACKKDPVHCVWNSWKQGACSKTCGDGTRVNTRTKKIEEKDSGTCSGSSTETKMCKERECEVHCEWNDWVIGECSLECGGGMRTNKRTEAKSANHGGDTCPGDSEMEESCNGHECPVDCVWGNWLYGECSEDCGGGSKPKMRVRTQVAGFGGKQCEGEGYGAEECNTHICHVDCAWNEWELGECSATCGGGTRVDTRTILSAELDGGFCDPEDNLRVEHCNPEACPPIHCEWDEWQLGECSEECGDGTQVNHRTKLIVEANGGTCDGQPEETVPCMIVECPIQCEWNDWNIGVCSLECGGGMRSKIRSGIASAGCPGFEYVVESCNVQECPVDCVWSPWTMGECSKTCGETTQFNQRIRYVEQFGGKPCEGQDFEFVACNLEPCPVCPEEKSEMCETYVNILPNMCEADWFVDPAGSYSCQKTCGLC